MFKKKGILGKLAAFAASAVLLLASCDMGSFEDDDSATKNSDGTVNVKFAVDFEGNASRATFNPTALTTDDITNIKINYNDEAKTSVFDGTYAELTEGTKAIVPNSTLNVAATVNGASFVDSINYESTSTVAISLKAAEGVKGILDLSGITLPAETTAKIGIYEGNFPAEFGTLKDLSAKEELTAGPYSIAIFASNGASTFDTVFIQNGFTTKPVIDLTSQSAVKELVTLSIVSSNTEAFAGGDVKVISDKDFVLPKKDGVTIKYFTDEAHTTPFEATKITENTTVYALVMFETKWDFLSDTAKSYAGFNGATVRTDGNACSLITRSDSTLGGYLSNGLWLVDGVYAEYEGSNGLGYTSTAKDAGTETSPIAGLEIQLKGPFTFKVTTNTNNSKGRKLRIFVNAARDSLFTGTPAKEVALSSKPLETTYEYTGTDTVYLGVGTSPDSESKIYTSVKSIVITSAEKLESVVTAGQIASSWATVKATYDAKYNAGEDAYTAGWADFAAAYNAEVPTTLEGLSAAIKAVKEKSAALVDYVAPTSIVLSANNADLAADSELTISTLEGAVNNVTVSAKVLPENASVKTFTWSISEGGFGTLKTNEDGTATVTATAAGNATLTATSSDPKASNIKASVTIKVTANQTYNVTFVDGSENPSVVPVVSGEKVTKPATDPTKAGYKFAGWVVSDATDAADFDFENTTITADTSVYAKWEELLFTEMIFDEVPLGTNNAAVNYASKSADYVSADGTWKIIHGINSSTATVSASNANSYDYDADAGTGYSYKSRIQAKLAVLKIKIGKGNTAILRIDGGSASGTGDLRTMTCTGDSTGWTSFKSSADGKVTCGYLTAVASATDDWVTITGGGHNIYGIHVVESKVDTSAIKFYDNGQTTYNTPVITVSAERVASNSELTVSAAATKTIQPLMADGSLGTGVDSDTEVTITVKDSEGTDVSVTDGVIDTSKIDTYTITATVKATATNDSPITATKTVEVYDASAKYHVVTFYDGTTPIAGDAYSFSVKAGDKITKPANPTKDDFKFVKWVTANEGSEAFDFDTPTADSEDAINIYASWEKLTSVSYELNLARTSEQWKSTSGYSLINDIFYGFNVKNEDWKPTAYSTDCGITEKLGDYSWTATGGSLAYNTSAKAVKNAIKVTTTGAAAVKWYVSSVAGQAPAQPGVYVLGSDNKIAAATVSNVKFNGATGTLGSALPDEVNDNKVVTSTVYLYEFTIPSAGTYYFGDKVVGKMYTAGLIMEVAK